MQTQTIIIDWMIETIDYDESIMVHQDDVDDGGYKKDHSI